MTSFLLPTLLLCFFFSCIGSVPGLADIILALLLIALHWGLRCVDEGCEIGDLTIS